MVLVKTKLMPTLNLFVKIKEKQQRNRVNVHLKLYYVNLLAFGIWMRYTPYSLVYVG